MHRNILFSALLLLFFSSLILAKEDGPEAEMSRGNEFYQAKNYTRAIDTYEALIEKGYSGTSLYYNLGNAYYRTGKLGYAILYYEKALSLSPSDDDVRHNLALANLHTADKIETFPPFFLFQWWESLLALLSVSGWVIVSYIFYMLLLLFIVLYFFAKQPSIQKISVYAGFIAVFLLAVAITLLTINLNRMNNVKKGIVVEPIVTAKLSPENNGKDAFIIHEGLKVNIEDKVDNWFKIKLEDGKIGWLPDDDLRII